MFLKATRLLELRLEYPNKSTVHTPAATSEGLLLTALSSLLLGTLTHLLANLFIRMLEFAPVP